MFTLNIDDVDASLEARLRESARANGHTVEEEARRIMEAALPQTPPPSAPEKKNLADAIREHFAPFGGVELDIPPRRNWREPPTFD